MVTPFFHLTPVKLKPGSIIEPGNWGRIIRSYRSLDGANAYNLVREQTFELVRNSHFQKKKPSRYNCVFLFESLDDASKFKEEQRPIDILYKVEILDLTKPLHRACMTLTNISPGALVIPQYETQAKQYWKGENIKSAEILTYSDIKILEILS